MGLERGASSNKQCRMFKLEIEQIMLLMKYLSTGKCNTFPEVNNRLVFSLSSWEVAHIIKQIPCALTKHIRQQFFFQNTILHFLSLLSGGYLLNHCTVGGNKTTWNHSIILTKAPTVSCRYTYSCGRGLGHSCFPSPRQQSRWRVVCWAARSALDGLTTWYLCAFVHALTRSVVQTVCINKHLSRVTFSSWLQSNWTNQHDVFSSPTRQSPLLPPAPVIGSQSPLTYPSTSRSHRSLCLMKNTRTPHNKMMTPLCLIVLYKERGCDHTATRP